MVDNSDAVSVTSAASASVTGGGGASAKQVTKLKDANAKYKNLLKMAKGRIQSQEEEIAKLKGEWMMKG